MAYLAELDQGRDNNLNLVRFLAASAVLVSHAFPIALGPGAWEPLDDLLGMSLGSLAVDMFFAISGYLITASFVRSSSVTGFVVARVLRLVPGLLVSSALVAFVLAPLVSSLGALAFLQTSYPYEFFVRAITLAKVQYIIPTVFQDLPYTAIVGSIWTLFYEVLCYGGVFVAGLLGVWRTRRRASLALLAYLALWLGLSIADLDLSHQVDRLMRLSFPFALGAAFFVWRDRLPITLWGVALSWAAAALAMGSEPGRSLLYLAIAYTTFWLGYVPGGVIRAYNAVGDYSYGIYIYAFPLQGFVVWLFGPQSPLENMLYAFPMTLVCSILSWHLLEEPALRLKGMVVRALRRA